LDTGQSEYGSYPNDIRRHAKTCGRELEPEGTHLINIDGSYYSMEQKPTRFVTSIGRKKTIILRDYTTRDIKGDLRSKQWTFLPATDLELKDELTKLKLLQCRQGYAPTM
jgi:hypothetical protein